MPGQVKPVLVQFSSDIRPGYVIITDEARDSTLLQVRTGVKSSGFDKKIVQTIFEVKFTQDSANMMQCT